MFLKKILFQRLSKELISTAILRPLTKTLNINEATIVPLSDTDKEFTEAIDSNRESQPQSKHPTNPLKHIIDKMEKKKLKTKLPDFGVTMFPIPLQWIEAVRQGEVCAEILCSAELIEVNLISKEKKENIFKYANAKQLPGNVLPTEPVTNHIGIPPEICPNVAHFK